MAPHRFRISRFSLIRRDPTRSVEVIIAFCNLIIPGIPMAFGASELPAVVVHIASNSYIDGGGALIGLGGVVFGIAQIWGAGTDWYAVRAMLATLIACILVALVAAYWWTGLDFRPTPWLMSGTVFAEAFLAWRCWHERPEPVSLGGGYHVPV